MTFTIPRPDWVSDRLIEERGPYAGFQMYTTTANTAVGKMIERVVASAEEHNVSRSQFLLMLEGEVNALRLHHPEVNDTEPEWAIVDAVNAFFDTQGWVHVDREVLF